MVALLEDGRWVGTISVVSGQDRSGTPFKVGFSKLNLPLSRVWGTKLGVPVSYRNSFSFAGMSNVIF